MSIVKIADRHESKHVNDFTAVQSMRFTIIGFAISVIAGIVMLFMFEGHAIWFSGLTFIIPIYFWNDQMQKTKAFNAIYGFIINYFN